MAVESEKASSTEHTHTVLIVEDEVLTRIVLAQHLRDCGYRVLEAGNAAEAILVLESDYVVDILFADVNLPGDMNGFALARWSHERRPQIRTILTSGTARAAQKASDLCDDEPGEVVLGHGFLLCVELSAYRQCAPVAG